MESPVVVDKPPEYGNAENERGFPFEEDEGAWSQLAARHPDIAARLRQQRPQGWARKRRPSAQGAPEDFPEEFSGFERFPFDDIPPEFRGHFPSHWNRRFGPEEQQQQQQQQQAQPPPQQPSQSPPPAAQAAAPNAAPAPPQRATIATQTEPEPAASPPPPPPPARAMSAPPDPDPHAPQDHSTNVRHIPIFVEGRDEPVINRNQNANFAESKPAYASPPHPDREQYFPDEGFHHPPNFSRTFGAPFKQGFRQGPQPFAQQKVFPQAAAFGRANSPHRSQSPRQEEFVNVPVHHERASPSPSGAQQQKQQQQQPSHQQQQQQYQQQQQQKFQQQQQAPPPQQPAGPKPPPPNANDPITQILAIQTDVLNLMTEVENFKGTKNDKGYLFLDEMLTRNLIKLDNIETDGKENIRQARKEAIKCIQKCISVLESKAEKNANPQPDVDMDGQQKGENGEVEMTENAKEGNAEPQAANTEKDTAKTEEPETADTRPADSTETKNEEQPANKDKKTKKKVVKKRDKSKDKKEGAKDSDSVTDSNKPDSNKKVEDMQVDDKGEKLDNSQNHAMEVDGAAASQ